MNESCIGPYQLYRGGQEMTSGEHASFINHNHTCEENRMDVERTWPPGPIAL